MGNFYVNFCVRTTNRDGVITALQQANRTAYISNVPEKYIVVCDKEADTQDDNEILNVGKLLSRELSAPTLGVLNHDDDILCYWLFENGVVTATYNSCPDCLGEVVEADNPNIPYLCSVFGMPALVDTLEEILEGDDEEIFAIEIHEALAEALQLPLWSVGIGFNYITKGELPLDSKETDWLRIEG